MERIHRTKMAAKFNSRLNGKRVICLGIADNYEFMAPAMLDWRKASFANKRCLLYLFMENQLHAK